MDKMDYLTINAKVIEGINYLYKHLYDNPAQNPTNVPKIGPNGKEITETKQISSILGVNKKIAAIYVLQDPNASIELKSSAREVINPGIFVASDDAFMPVIHK